MKYKFKKHTQNIKPCTSEFWYDVAYGGYLKAEDFSADPQTIEAIKEAVKLLIKLEDMCDLV
jgi:hypothetical protein